jgi:hypothetical protein
LVSSGIAQAAGQRSEATTAAPSRMWMLPRYWSEKTTGMTRNPRAHGPVSHSSANPMSSVHSAWKTSNLRVTARRLAKNSAAGGV